MFPFTFKEIRFKEIVIARIPYRSKILPLSAQTVLSPIIVGHDIAQQTNNTFESVIRGEGGGGSGAQESSRSSTRIDENSRVSTR